MKTHFSLIISFTLLILANLFNSTVGNTKPITTHWNEPVSVESNIARPRSIEKDYAKLKNKIRDEGMRFFNMGTNSMKNQEFQESVKQLDKAIDLLPGLVPAYLNRGRVRIHLKDYKGAYEDFTYAISLNADFTPAYLCRANLLYICKSYTEAIEDYDQAIKLAPELPDSHYNKGILLLEIGDHSSSLTEMKKAVSCGSSKAAAFIQRNLFLFVQ